MIRRVRDTRVGAILLAGWGALVGAAPHVLHHVGPLAGAALLAGAEGKILFGAIGFALSIPFLRRLYQRFKTPLAPALAGGAFIAIFAFSTLVVSPAISDRGGGSPSIQQQTDHAAHHRK